MEAQKLATFETKRRNPELYRLSKEHAVYLGRLAIKSEHLGINTPLTHLYQFLDRGEASMNGIKEDIITDIAERLPRTPFTSQVGFEFTGNDFISIKDKVSMAKMTKTTIDTLAALKKEKLNNPELQAEYIRAEIEAQEVDKLTDWFNDAEIGACLVFESLPIGNQKFAISRIYQKDSNRTINGSFISLYSSSVSQFNQLHEILDVDVPKCQNETEILQNNYEYYNPKVTPIKSFIDNYVRTYDKLLESRTNRQYSFGLETDKNTVKQNGIQKVKNNPRLTNEYLKTVRILATSGGVATAELIKINNSLDTGYNLTENQNISINIASKILEKVILGITSAIDNADSKLLEQLEESYAGTDTNFSAISFFADQASSRGETYTSNGCPEFGRNQSTNEQEAMENGFRIEPDDAAAFGNKLPKNFGQPKIGVCRIDNCPSRGELWWWPDRTLVGGCSVCLCCHKYFAEGKSPELVYENQKIKQEQKVKQIAQEKLAKRAKRLRKYTKTSKKLSNNNTDTDLKVLPTLEIAA